MLDFMRMGGVMMWITLLLAIIGLTVVALQLTRRDRNYTPLIVGMSSATLLTGALGTCAGLVGVVMATGMAAPEMHETLMLKGFSEAINNIIFGICLCFLQVVSGSIAVFRRT